jgi:predicted ferric reductase
MTTTALDRTSAASQQLDRGVRSPLRPRNRAGDLAALVAGLGGGLTAAITAPVVLATSWSAPGALASALGIITAMAGTYLALLSILLMARLPWLEHEVGQDRLTAWHRTLGPSTLVLIVAHVVFTTLGYAQASGIGWWDQLVGLTFGYAWMLPAAAATIIMVALGVMSWRRIRSRMRYETWHVAHLYFYLAVALGFGHQLESGSVFRSAPLATAWWVGLYVAVALAILVFRFGAPLVQSLRHSLRIAAVVPVTDDVAHVYVTGRDLDRLGAQGGQWFSFRFGTRRWWWQGHPYSLSAGPTSAGMRITVKDLGDQSGQLTTMAPGTRVFVEGPYGAFRADQRRSDRLLLIGAGIGITPIRALLDELPDGVQADAVYRVHAAPAPLADELELIARRSRGRIRLHVLAGSRRDHPMSARALSAICPDIAGGDVYVCGPTAFVQDVVDASLVLGVDAESVHHELFEF